MDPILVLQMQRMGDLVLSFPLLGWLGGAFPGHPIWVVGEQAFFEPLMPLSPRVTYFSYAGAPNFTNERFHAVINLSHRPEAARLAGAARSDVLVGPYLAPSGELHIQGDWQLYRASLTHNNRYNLYHWADLNALDLISSEQMLRTNWPLPRRMGAEEKVMARRDEAPAGGGAAFEKEGDAPLGKKSSTYEGARIGLFLGASEPDKRPDAEFWAALARLLLKAGHKPVFLGGDAEKALGRQVAALSDAGPLNLCGRFTVSALAEFIAGLDLLVTPDTGPMHVAVWSGTPVLNISLGPVNPWETGPFAPGHHVVRPVLDCIGCWGCVRPTVECKEGLVPGRVVSVIEALLGARSFESLERTARGVELLRTRRGGKGLFHMDALLAGQAGEGFLTTALREGGSIPDCGHETSGCAQRVLALARQEISLFWQAWFGEIFGRMEAGGTFQAWSALRERHPQAAEAFMKGLADMAQALAKTVRTDAAYLLGNPDFWQAVPPPLRPLSGYIHMYVQNRHANRASLLHAVSLVDRLLALR